MYLLHRLFDTVSIPTEVARELRDRSAPAGVQEWVNTPPIWLNVLEPTKIAGPTLNALDPGERSAIALGIALKADLILMDERKGSMIAASKGLETTGTLGILDLAAKRKQVDLRDAIERLKTTNFRYRKDLIERLLAQHQDT